MTNDVKPDGILVPRAIVWAVLLAVPTMLISGTTYVVLSASHASMQTDRITKMEARADTLADTARVVRLENRVDSLAAAERVAKLEARVDAASSAGEQSRQAIVEMVQSGNGRLIRMEAQLGFLVNSYATPVAAKPGR